MRHDEAYQNLRHIPGGEAYAPRWAEKSSAFRAALGSRFCGALRYGPGESDWFDLFLPSAAPEGLLIFLHGGYWLAFGPRDYSHLAAGAIARGWACALPAYALAPKARIGAMSRQIAAALPVIAAEVPAGPVVVTGHSAGGHLAARLANADLPLPDPVKDRLARIVPISPIADLRPLLETSMNATLGLTPAEARSESPALQPRRPGPEVRVWVGGAERPAFLDQARRLGNAFACPVTVEPDRHHFNVVEGLEDPGSPLMAALLA